MSVHVRAVGRADVEQHVAIERCLAAEHLLEQLLAHRTLGLEREQVGTEQRNAFSNRIDDDDTTALWTPRRRRC